VEIGEAEGEAAMRSGDLLLLNTIKRRKRYSNGTALNLHVSLLCWSRDACDVCGENAY
jgi:hypothetical protein